MRDSTRVSISEEKKNLKNYGRRLDIRVLPKDIWVRGKKGGEHVNRKQAFNYLESPYKNLDEAKRKRFLVILFRADGKGTEEDISKIKIVGDEIFYVQGIEPREVMIKTMIKKACKKAKEEKQYDDV